MDIRYLDLRIDSEHERELLQDALERVMSHGRILLGPEVEELERQVAERAGSRYAVGVGSGTDALILALRALAIGPGDEVIMPPLSFIATANAVSLVGATPVFADIGPDLNLDPDSVAGLIGPTTRAIVPVHWTGRLCDMDAIMTLAERHGLWVIEDASQAFDAERHGKKAGSFGHIGCFSMNPMKVFAALGEAGMLVTDNDDLHRRLQTLRYHGMPDRERCTTPSYNARLDTLQAAILLQRLPLLDGLIARRQQHAAGYDRRLHGVVKTPPPEPDGRHVYYTYTIRTPQRDALLNCLSARGIECKIHHTLLMPQQPCFGGRARGRYPNAERLVQQVLSLPASEKLTDEQRERVTDAVIDFSSEGV